MRTGLLMCLLKLCILFNFYYYLNISRTSRIYYLVLSNKFSWNLLPCYVIRFDCMVDEAEVFHLKP